MKLFNAVVRAYKIFFQHLMFGKDEYGKSSNSSVWLHQHDHDDELIESVFS